MGKLRANKDNAKFISKVYAQEDGYKASAMLTLTQPTDGDYIKLNGVQFTFRDEPADSSNDVDIGADISASIDNLLLEPSLPDTATYTRVGTDGLKIEYKTIGAAGNDYTIEVSWADSQPTSLSGGSDTPDTDWVKGEMTAKFKYPEIPVGSDSTSSVLYSAGIDDGDDILLYNSTNGIVKNEGITINNTSSSSSSVDTVDPFGDGSGVALYKLDGDVTDAGGNYDGTEIGDGILGYDDGGHYGKGVVVYNENDAGIISIDEIAETKSAFTYSAWVNADTGDNGSYCYIFRVGDKVIGLSPSFSNNSDVENTITCQLDGKGVNVSFGNTLDPEDAFFVVYTWDKTKNDGKPKIYVKNYTKAWEMSAIVDNLAVTSDLSKGFDVIAGINSSYSNRRKIIIDQVRIFNRVLTDDEVTALYNEELKQLDISGLSETPTKAWKYVPPKLALSIAPTEQDLRIEDVELSKVSSTTTEFVGKAPNNINIVNGENVLLGGSLVALNDDVVKELGTIDNVNPFGDNSGIDLWKLDGNANSATGNHDGTWDGTEDYDTGKYGQAAKFDGNSKVGISHTFTETEFSYSVWVYPNNNNNDSMIILCDRNGADAKIKIFCSISFKDNDNNISFYAGDSSSSYGIHSPENETEYLNKWTLLTGVYDGNKLSAYINGEKIGETGSFTITNENTDLRIGGDYSSDDFYGFIGLIDQVRIFNRALTDDEVAELYNEEIYKYTLKFSQQSEAPQTAVIPKKSTEFTIPDTNATYDNANDVFMNTSKLTLDNVTGRRLQYMIEAPAKNTKIEQLNIDLYKE